MEDVGGVRRGEVSTSRGWKSRRSFKSLRRFNSVIVFIAARDVNCNSGFFSICREFLELTRKERRNEGCRRIGGCCASFTVRLESIYDENMKHYDKSIKAYSFLRFEDKKSLTGASL